MTAPVKRKYVEPEIVRVFDAILADMSGGPTRDCLDQARNALVDSLICLEDRGASFKEMKAERDALQTQLVTAHSDLVTERAAHAETMAAANRHLSCTAKAVAELEEAKRRVGELEQCLLDAPENYDVHDCGKSDVYATTYACTPTYSRWLVSRALLIAGAGAKRDAPRCCPAWDSGHCAYHVDERAGGDACPLSSHRFAYDEPTGSDRCEACGAFRPSPPVATPKTRGEMLSCMSAIKQARPELPSTLLATQGEPVAKQAGGRPEWADDVTIEDIALRLDAGWPNLERGVMRAKAESLRRLLAYTKRIKTDIADYRQGIEPDGTGRHASFVVYKNKMKAAIERAEAAEQLALSRLAEANAACVRADSAKKRVTEAEANLCIAKIAAGEMNKRIAQLEAEITSRAEYFNQRTRALVDQLAERDRGGERRTYYVLETERVDYPENWEQLSPARSANPTKPGTRERCVKVTEIRQPLSAAAAEVGDE